MSDNKKVVPKTGRVTKIKQNPRWGPAGTIIGRKTHPEFEKWYANDYKNSGFTTPWLKYQGPGNSTNIGAPVSNPDRYAQKHDINYALAGWKYSTGRVSKEQYEKDIVRADRNFLSLNANTLSSSVNPLDHISAAIGTVGIGIKHTFEHVFGQVYPDTDPKKAHTPHESENEISSVLPSEENSSMGTGEPDAKKPKIADTASSGDLPPNTPADAPPVDEMGLPGTAQGQADSGAGSTGPPVHYVDRPMSMFGAKLSTYKKVHRFLTWGWASAFLNGTNVVNGDIFLTTSFAEIPWHIPALYLTPSEFDLLGVSAQCKSVSVSVVYRGTSTQFETNASTTTTATLNHISDISVAHGLNRTGWGSNYSIASMGTNPLIPGAITKPKYAPVGTTYRGMAVDYYGDANATAAFKGSIPKHQIGKPAVLYNYFGMSARGGLPAAATGVRQFGGWPALREKYETRDAKTSVNMVVAESTYEPKFAPLKNTLRSQGHGLPFPIQNLTIEVPGLGNLVNRRQTSIQVTNVVPSAGGMQAASSEQTSNTDGAVSLEPTYTMFLPLEKSQYGRSGYWGEVGGHIQPSIHIAQQPTPALTTAAIVAGDGQFNSWVDTQAVWDVTCTMVVQEQTPTAYPYATAPNIPMGENVLWSPVVNRPAALVDPRDDGATICGLYTNQAAF